MFDEGALRALGQVELVQLDGASQRVLAVLVLVVLDVREAEL